MNKETAKAKAKALQTFMAEKGFPLKHSAALEAVARIEGFPSYNVLQSQLEDARPVSAVAEVSVDQGGWDIEVCRIGYATMVVIVKGACTAKEAAERALEDMNSDNFGSDEESDYFIVGKEEGEAEPEALFFENETPGEPRTWEVAVNRKAYGTKTLRITGANLTREQAEERALDEAGNHYYSTKDNEYEVSGAYPCTTNAYD
jgi:hypothetical protein